MKCELCGINNATIFKKISINDLEKESYICADCANQDEFDNLSSVLFEGITEKVCECGTSFVDIKQSGFVGCQKCYTTFIDELTPVISSLHGSVSNQGKKPLTKIEKLEKQIDEAVANKFYELAVKLNDQLKILKGDNYG